MGQEKLDQCPKKLGVWELRGDYQNNIGANKKINATMLKLPELSEMIEQLNDDPRGFHENTEDREYFH